MVFNLRLILLIAALLCFVAASFGVRSRIGLQPLGLALVTLAFILG